MFGNEFWSGYIKKEYGSLKLSDLTKSKDKFHFRLWFFGDAISSAVDVYSGNGSSYNANVTHLTKEYLSNTKENAKPRIYRLTTIIRPDVAFKMYQLIVSQQIIKIPTGLKINGWSNGKDGVDYLIEYSDINNYTFKEYWTPESQRDVKEAKIIQAFVNELYSIIAIDKLNADFIKVIPFETYHADGIIVGSKRPAKFQN